MDGIVQDRQTPNRCAHVTATSDQCALEWAFSTSPHELLSPDPGITSRSPAAQKQRRQFGRRADFEMPEDGFDVVADRVFGDSQLVGDGLAS